MLPSRFFVTDNNVATLCNGTRSGMVVFESAEEFKRITGDDLPHEDYIAYEPDDGHYYDEHNRALNADDIPNPQYENWIKYAAIYKARQEDPTYGRTPEELLQQRIFDARQKVQTAVYTLVENNGRAALKKLKTMPEDDVQKMVTYVSQLENYVELLKQQAQPGGNVVVTMSDAVEISEDDDENVDSTPPQETVMTTTDVLSIPEPVWPFPFAIGDTSIWW
jgi:hypothetical protein